MHGVDGKLLDGGRSFYQENKSCIPVGREEGEWFSVKVGLS